MDRLPDEETNRSLPLRPPGAPEDGADREVPSEAEIRAVVDAFYDVACRDELLGPVFERHIEDWSSHLPRMYDFWSAVALGSRRYAGRPFEAHQALPELTRPHFERWLALWEATVRSLVPAAACEALLAPAARMAASMPDRLFESRPGRRPR